jgi:hypothetical protein
VKLGFVLIPASGPLFIAVKLYLVLPLNTDLRTENLELFFPTVENNRAYYYF